MLLGVLEGPQNTPYENGFFIFKMLIPKDLPFQPPEFIFISNIFHPNISENGFVFVDILRNQWSPALEDFEAIIYSIQSFLDTPNPDEFLNENAAKLYKEDKTRYNEFVREYTSIYSNYSKFLEDIKYIWNKYPNN
jgi:ubiquitin-protein ligase